MADGLFYGTVTAAGVKLDQEAAYHQFARRKWLGKPVEVIIRGKRSKRTLAQNRLLWGQVLPALAEELGYDRHELELLHYGLLGKRFGTKKDKLSGLELPVKTSSQLSTKEFSDYVDWTVRLAAVDYGIVIDLPGDVL